MTTRRTKNDQMELNLTYDNRWIYVFSSMATSGRLRDLGGNALMVFLVMKVNSNFRTNVSYVSIDHLKWTTKLGHSALKKAIAKLEEFKYLKSEKKGKRWEYQLFDVIDFTDKETGNYHTSAIAPYIPTKRGLVVEDLRDIAALGQIAAARGTGTHIQALENAVVSQISNSQNAVIDNSTTTNVFQVVLPAGTSAEQAQEYIRSLAKLGKAGEAIDRMRKQQQLTIEQNEN